MEYSNYKKANDVPIEYVLNICNMRPDKYGRYICPFHNDSKPSAYITKVNRLFCFGCENEEGFKGWSNIDIVMKSLNTTKEDAVKIILNLGEGNTSPHKKNPYVINEINRRKESKEENPEFEEIRENFLIKARTIKDSDKTDFIKYLNKRKINERVLEVLDKNNVIYGTDEYNQPGFVFGYKHCVFRHKERNENHSSVITKGAGTYVKIESNKMPIYFIVEGIYDALTLLDRNTPANVICLNSISNTDDLIRDIKNDLNNKKYIFILALDNDERGIKTRDKIEKEFIENNVRHRYFMDLVSNPNCKDVNELRQKGII